MTQLQMSLVTHLNWHVPVSELYQLYFAPDMLGLHWVLSDSNKKISDFLEKQPTEIQGKRRNKLKPIVRTQIGWCNSMEGQEEKAKPELFAVEVKLKKRKRMAGKATRRGREERPTWNSVSASSFDYSSAPPRCLPNVARQACVRALVRFGLEGRHASRPINSRRIHDFDSRGTSGDVATKHWPKSVGSLVGAKLVV